MPVSGGYIPDVEISYDKNLVWPIWMGNYATLLPNLNMSIV